MAFKLSDLPYAYEALEPHIDAKTMEIHHSKHHNAYTTNLNNAVAGTPLEAKNIEEILKNISTAAPVVRNNGGGFYNHNLFWEVMSPNGGGLPTGALAEAINAAFGSFDAFKTEFANAGATRFGSGWAWLLVKADLQSGALRLTFGNLNAIDGIETVTVIVAIFALGEALYLASRHQMIKTEVIEMKGKAWMTREDFKRSWKPWLRGTAIGFPLGVIPAGGSEVPTFLSYGVEKALSKNKNEFGKGAIEGVAGPEAANNANAAGVLVPMLALGLPTSATAAVVLVAFQSFNIQPGPMLFQTNPEIVWGLIASLFIGNFLLLVLNLPLIRFWVLLLKIPNHYLYAGITTFALLGAYALNNSTFDLQVALVIGAIGFLFRRFGVPITPLIIGAILGPLAELYFKRALQISQGDWHILIAGGFPKVIYGLLFLVIIGPLVWNFKKKFAVKK